jgi:hypothetical protein
VSLRQRAKPGGCDDITRGNTVHYERVVPLMRSRLAQ